MTEPEGTMRPGICDRRSDELPDPLRSASVLVHARGWPTKHVQITYFRPAHDLDFRHVRFSPQEALRSCGRRS